MSYDFSKNIELYLLRAANLDEGVTPNQRRYYIDAAEWLSRNRFDSLQEATEAMKKTEYYEGAGIAKIMDDIELRIKAMEDVGYHKAADVHRERREKFRRRGNEYAFSQEWIDDLADAADKKQEYAKRKEVFGRIFLSYVQLQTDPERTHRKEYVKELGRALDDLQALGAGFDELAADDTYISLTMATPEGMEHFTDFVHSFIASGRRDPDDPDETAEEQKRLEKWARAHEKELKEAGKQEKWHQAACIAVPSDDPCGYRFISLREEEY